jgi:hypothetical protein
LERLTSSRFDAGSTIARWSFQIISIRVTGRGRPPVGADEGSMAGLFEENEFRAIMLVVLDCSQTLG